MKTSVAYALGLARVEGVGAVLFRRLVTAFGDPRKVFEADRRRLVRIEGISEKGSETLARRLAAQPEWPDIEREIELAYQRGAEIDYLGSEGYPPLLAAIHDPPPILYRIGNYLPEDTRAIALVGTRKPTRYGSAQTQQFAAELASAGFSVISGLALGVDGLAHRAVLEAGGRTIAVLGSGLGQIYPKEHIELAERVGQHGVLFSEFPFNAPPEARNFPKRNRIISGLSLGVLVIEAGERSGSLISARYGLEQGREIYALPGNVTSPYSRGANRLIRDGARLVETAADILEDLQPICLQTRENREANPTPVPRPQPILPMMDSEEKALYSFLSEDPIHLDSLGEKSGLGVHEISHLLLQMELKGWVQALGGGFYISAI